MSTENNQVSTVITTDTSTEVVKQRQPNELSGVYFSSSIKITDVETGEVLVQRRCD